MKENFHQFGAVELLEAEKVIVLAIRQHKVGARALDKQITLVGFSDRLVNTCFARVVFLSFDLLVVSVALLGFLCGLFFRGVGRFHVLPKQVADVPSAVVGVVEDGVAVELEVHADLVRAAGLREACLAHT